MSSIYSSRVFYKDTLFIRSGAFTLSVMLVDGCHKTLRFISISNNRKPIYTVCLKFRGSAPNKIFKIQQLGNPEASRGCKLRNYGLSVVVSACKN